MYILYLILVRIDFLNENSQLSISVDHNTSELYEKKIK